MGREKLCAWRSEYTSARVARPVSGITTPQATPPEQPITIGLPFNQICEAVV
jgi:hypothetical protein